MVAVDQLEGYCRGSSSVTDGVYFSESVINLVALEMRGNKLRIYSVGRLIQLGSISLNAARERRKKKE